MKRVSVVLVGIGGYGNVIAGKVFEHTEDYGVDVVGIVDCCYEKAPLKAEAEKRNIPHYDTLEEFYAEHSAELAVICTPIQFHEEHCITAMRHGSDCLCEKPTAALLSQSDRMQQVARETGRNINIGFQLSYTPAVLGLKEDIMRGAFGRPVSMSAVICWPRNLDYYARVWSGRIRFNGQYVLDSIAMNACAHYLHLMFFLLGSSVEKAAMPSSVRALLCRANDIETFDTSLLEAEAAGVTIRFSATHSCETQINPIMKFVFENAVIKMRESDRKDAITATFNDGTVKTYGPIRQDLFQKIPYCCDIVRGLKKPVCTTETARAHLKCVNAVTELVPVFTGLEKTLVNNTVVVEGMDRLLKQAFDEDKMPWELTDRFGQPTLIDLTSYKGWDEKA